MFDDLALAIDGLEVPREPAALAEVLTLADRLQAVIVAGVAQVDAGGRWADQGASSMTAWLRHHGRLAGSEAHRVVLLARRLAGLPATANAWACGLLSAWQTTAICANATQDVAALLAEHEADLLASLATLSVRQTAQAMRVWRAHAEAVVDTPEPEPAAEARRSYNRSQLPDGTWVYRIRLDAEAGALVDLALDLATTADCPSEPARTTAERRADALVDLARTALDHGLLPDTGQPRAGGRRRPHLEILVDLEDLHDGPASTYDVGLRNTALRRYACDSTIHRIVADATSRILDYGRGTRAVPRHLYRALVHRDGGCRFPGCDRPPWWTEAHHVQHWIDGGETNQDNLMLLCTRHHHLCHEPGWRVKLLPDASVHVTAPDGSELVSRPPPRPG
jgi:hypothetical protein